MGAMKKNGLTRRTHLLVSSLIWSSVGLLLLVRGVLRSPHGEALLLFCGALVIGVLKSRFMLDRVAVRILDHIDALEEPASIWRLYSVRNWLLVAAMVVIGVVLKSSSLPAILLCFIYLTVGWALLLSSRHSWRAFFCPEGRR